MFPGMAKYIYSVNRLICCCFSSFCGVSTYKFNRYPSSQASTELRDPTSDVYIVAFSFSIYEIYPSQFHFGAIFVQVLVSKDKSGVVMNDAREYTYQLSGVGEWSSGLYSLRLVTKVKLGRLYPGYQSLKIYMKGN